MIVTPGRVTGTEIQDGRTILTVQFAQDEDVQTVELAEPAGTDTGVTVGSRVFVLTVTTGWKIAVAADDGVDRESGPGEKRVYSTDSDGAKQAEITLTADGNIHLNGDGKRLVTYAELDTALQGLIDYINAHTHSGVSSGGSTSGPPATPATLDISASETQTLMTDG